jgi:hypothetical protein
MPIQISSPEQMREHVKSIREKAQHHAPNVIKLWPALVGYCYSYSDRDDYHARATASGDMGLQSWVTINSKRLALTYNYRDGGRSNGRVDISHNSILLISLNNATTLDEIFQFFESL